MSLPIFLDVLADFSGEMYGVLKSVLNLVIWREVKPSWLAFPRGRREETTSSEDLSSARTEAGAVQGQKQPVR